MTMIRFDASEPRLKLFVRISSDGCKIVLEKRDGEWVALEWKDPWIQ